MRAAGKYAPGAPHTSLGASQPSNDLGWDLLAGGSRELLRAEESSSSR